MMSHPASVIEGGEVGQVEEENVERRRGERTCGTDSAVGRDRGEYVGSVSLGSQLVTSRQRAVPAMTYLVVYALLHYGQEIRGPNWTLSGQGKGGTSLKESVL